MGRPTGFPVGITVGGAPVGGIQSLDARAPLKDPDLIPQLRAEACVCCVMFGGDERGSGVLIAADLVLTNHHVVSDSDTGVLRNPGDLSCRFDEGGRAFGVKSIEIANARSPRENDITAQDKADFLRASDGRPYLDYAVLRLTETVGLKSSGRVGSATFEPLGWVTADDAVWLGVGTNIKLYQYAQSKLRQDGRLLSKAVSMQSDSNLIEIAGGLRFRHHASSTKGSSGSAAYDIGTRLVAIHNAGWQEPDDADGPRATNQIIPLKHILADMEAELPALREEIRRAAGSPPESRILGAPARSGTTGVSPQVKRAVTALLDRDDEVNAVIAKLRVGEIGFRVFQIFYDDNTSAFRVFQDRLNMLLGDVKSFGIIEPNTEDIKAISGRLTLNYPNWAIDSRTGDTQTLTENINNLVFSRFNPRSPYLEVYRYFSAGQSLDQQRETEIVAMFLDALQRRLSSPETEEEKQRYPIVLKQRYPIVIWYAAAALNAPAAASSNGSSATTKICLAGVRPSSVRSGFENLVVNWFGTDDAIPISPEMTREEPVPMTKIVELMEEPVKEVCRRLMDGP